MWGLWWHLDGFKLAGECTANPTVASTNVHKTTGHWPVPLNELRHLADEIPYQAGMRQIVAPCGNTSDPRARGRRLLLLDVLPLVHELLMQSEQFGIALSFVGGKRLLDGLFLNVPDQLGHEAISGSTLLFLEDVIADVGCSFFLRHTGEEV